MSWVNLLEIIYPVGAIYLSNSSTSPANIVGGSWTQVTGAVLGAAGANSFATGGSYGGNLKIALAQIPQHQHTNTWHSSQWTGEGSGNQNSSEWGGYATADTRTATYTSPAGQIQGWTTQSNFLPYHFSTYIWYRTA